MPEGSEEVRTDQTAGESTQDTGKVTDEELHRAWKEETSGAQEDRQEEAAQGDEGAGEAVTEESSSGEKEGKGEEQEKAEGESAAQEGEQQSASEAQGETATDDADEHKDRTKLGRKVARLESTLSEVLEQNRILLEKLTAPKEPEGVSETAHVMTDEQVMQRYDELHAESPYKAQKFLREVEQSRELSQTSAYQMTYKKSLDAWKKSAESSVEDGDDDGKGSIADIFKLLTDSTQGAPFNRKYSDNPSFDFERNLTRAEAHYWREKAKSPRAQERKNPLEANREAKAKAATGVGGASKTEPAKTKPSLNLTDAEREAMQRWNWTEDQVREFLSQPTTFVNTRGGTR